MLRDKIASLSPREGENSRKLHLSTPHILEEVKGKSGSKQKERERRFSSSHRLVRREFSSLGYSSFTDRPIWILRGIWTGSTREYPRRLKRKSDIIREACKVISDQRSWFAGFSLNWLDRLSDRLQCWSVSSYLVCVKMDRLVCSMSMSVAKDAC